APAAPRPRRDSPVPPSSLLQSYEIGELPIGLDLDVKGLFAAPRPAFVAGDDEGPDLGPKLLVVAASGSLGVEVEQPGDLGLDVDLGILATRAPPVGPGLEHLARLGFLDGPVDLVGRSGGRWRRRLFDREPTAADSPPGAPRAGEADRRDRQHDK